MFDTTTQSSPSIIQPAAHPALLCPRRHWAQSGGESQPAPLRCAPAGQPCCAVMLQHGLPAGQACHIYRLLPCGNSTPPRQPTHMPHPTPPNLTPNTHTCTNILALRPFGRWLRPSHAAEVRLYAPYLIAEVVVQGGSMRDALSNGFRQASAGNPLWRVVASMHAQHGPWMCTGGPAGSVRGLRPRVLCCAAGDLDPSRSINNRWQRAACPFSCGYGSFPMCFCACCGKQTTPPHPPTIRPPAPPWHADRGVHLWQKYSSGWPGR